MEATSENTAAGETEGTTSSARSVVIERLELTDILSFGPQSPPIDLGPLNVLIGPNASGKSNLIRVFHLLAKLAAGEQILTPDGSRPADWIRRGKHPSLGGSVRIRLRHEAGPLTYDLGIRCVDDHFEVLSEGVDAGAAKILVRSELPPPRRTLVRNEGNLTPIEVQPRTSCLAAVRFSPELLQIADVLTGVAIHQDWSFGSNAPLRRPQSANFPSDILQAHASNLGLVLNRLNQVSSSKERLIDALQDLYEGVSDLRVDVAQGHVEIGVQEGDSLIPASHLSDGTLRYLCLLAILCDPDPPPLTCIEEPELGLHPDILPTVGELLVDASTRTQLIVTTHSDVLVDALGGAPESVVVCEKHDGQTHLKRMDRAEIAGWLERYSNSLGALWTRGHLGGTRH